MSTIRHWEAVREELEALAAQHYTGGIDMTCHTHRQRTMPPRAVDQFRGVKEEFHVDLAEEERRAQQESDDAMGLVVLLFVVLVIFVVSAAIVVPWYLFRLM